MKPAIDAWLPKSVILLRNYDRQKFLADLTAGIGVAGVALAVTVAVSLGGFMLGYRGAIDKSINMLGFQVMIMAKGCPYEAATMMLKGGTGLLYLPGDTYQKVKSDPDIESITPIFIGVAQREAASATKDRPVTSRSSAASMCRPTWS